MAYFERVSESAFRATDKVSGACQHVRAVATERVTQTLGNVGGGILAQIRETLAVLLDL